MTAEECRERARECRAQADLASGDMKADFLAAAETWEKLAAQTERTSLFGGVFMDEGSSKPR